jgi:hypothetical protein
MVAHRGPASSRPRCTQSGSSVATIPVSPMGNTVINCNMCCNTHLGGSIKCMDQQQSYPSLEFLVQQTLAVVQIFVHPFSCNWFTFSCCSFDNNTINKLYKKLAILGPTDADCCVHFCASTHLRFIYCCSSFGNNTQRINNFRSENAVQGVHFCACIQL